MNYDLARRLKDAGFPQDGAGDFLYDYDQPMGLHGYPSYYCPTLEEVIEACGEMFLLISMTHSSNPEDKRWHSLGGEKIETDNIHCYGTTPLEAVCDLWLALYK